MSDVILHVYFLRKEAAPIEAKRWIERLQTYARGEFAVFTAERHSAADAPWVGTPFLLVGTKRHVLEYFQSLKDETRRVLADCAYYWILSDEPAPDPSEALPGARRDRTVWLNWKFGEFNVVHAESWRPSPITRPWRA